MDSILEILSKTKSAKVISSNIDYTDYVALDLSVTNRTLVNKTLETSQDYEQYIQHYFGII